jgi:endonuclease YncB( thermonuclease family)
MLKKASFLLLLLIFSLKGCFLVESSYFGLNVKNLLKIKDCFILGVIDGDTLLIYIKEENILDRGRYILRLLGIDSPEREEPFYLKAKNYTKRLKRKKVSLLIPKEQRYDSYGRLLGFIILKKNKILNLELLELGLAKHYIFRGQESNFSDYNLWLEKEKEAQKKKLNMWSRLGKEGVIIKEAYPNPYPELDRRSEFLELFCYKFSGVSLEGWYLQGGRWELKLRPNIRLNKGEYLIVTPAKIDEFLRIYPQLKAKLVSLPDFYLPNYWRAHSRYTLYLRDENGYIQDILYYDLTRTHKGANNTGFSIERDLEVLFPPKFEVGKIRRGSPGR